MKFSQNALQQVAGFDGQIIAQQLVFNQKDFWNFRWTNQSQSSGWEQTAAQPIDLTGVEITAEIVRRAITDLRDTRTGLDFKIFDYPKEPKVAEITEINDEVLIADSTAQLFVDKPIQFTGTVFGGINRNQVYTVTEIISDTEFKIDQLVTDASGLMHANTTKPTPIQLPITNRSDESGTFTVTLDSEQWQLIAGDPNFDIDVSTPACFSGRIRLRFPQQGTQPQYDEVVFLLFLITSDGVINYD